MDSIFHTSHTADVYGIEDEDITLPESETDLNSANVGRSNSRRRYLRQTESHARTAACWVRFIIAAIDVYSSVVCIDVA